MKSKKIVSLLVVSVLSLGLMAGCGNDSSSSSEDSSSSSSSSSSSEEASSSDENSSSSSSDETASSSDDSTASISDEPQELQEVTEDENEKNVDVSKLDKTVSVINSCGTKVKELKISPASKDKWGSNLLSGEVDNGQTVSIHFKGDTPTNYWDIKMIDINGKETVWSTVEIFKSTEIKLLIEQGSPSTECIEEPSDDMK